MKPPLIGAIEAGGTKFQCAIGREGEGLLESGRIACTNPGETMGKVFDFFSRMEEKHGKLEAWGIGSFGPIDVDPESPTYGSITDTPKAPWRNFDFLGAVKSRYPLPVGWDTDVNAAVLAEGLWGAGKDCTHLLYLTVGTGIGGGYLYRGKILHGLSHTEMGHIFLPHDHAKDPFNGICPFHEDCLEGLASGPAVSARWNQETDKLPSHHQAWDLEAEYLAKALVNFVLTLSPRKIILGGGLMKVGGLREKIRRKFQEQMNSYLRHDVFRDRIDSFLAAPGLEDESGMLGAFALGCEAWRKGRTELKPEI